MSSSISIKSSRFYSTTSRLYNAASSSSSELSNLKIGMCQIAVDPVDKDINIDRAKTSIIDAVNRNSELIILPEVWNSPYATTSFPEYAEIIPSINTLNKDISLSNSPSIKMLSDIALEKNVWIIGGSIPEYCENTQQIFNTCPIFNPSGILIGKHRKVHLFDIDVKLPKPMYFKESDTLTAGDDYTIIDTPWGKIGIGICYDIRFPEFAAMMRKKDVNILCYPGAFNMVTGPAHWELLARTRAVDNQVFTILCSPARIQSETGYIAYGHSLVVDPWGEIKLDAGPDVSTNVVNIDLNKLKQVRSSVPYWDQKRNDIYKLE